MRVYMIMGTVVYRTHHTWLSRLFLICVTLFMIWTVLISLQLKSVFEVPVDSGPVLPHTDILGILRDIRRSTKAERGADGSLADDKKCLYRRGKTSIEKDSISRVGEVCQQPTFVSPDDKVQLNFSGVSIDVVNREIFSKRTFAKIRHLNKEAQGAVDETTRNVLSDVSRRGRTCLRSSITLDDYIYTPGGHWKPRHCVPRWKVAVVVPFRDRFTQLPIFLRHLVPFLKKQLLEFGIYIIEQNNNEPFNKAFLMNVGFLESLRFQDWDCVVHHDVDHVPLSYANYYGCGEMPRHFMSGEDTWDYKILYPDMFGQVFGVTRKQMEVINGFPNVYWGWGVEDDAIYSRILLHGYNRSRPVGEVGYYNTIRQDHKQSESNKVRHCLLRHGRERVNSDGLYNIWYSVPRITVEPLYINVSVDIRPLPWNATWTSCEHNALSNTIGTLDFFFNTFLGFRHIFRK
ncbi:beta-1,4-galactosyltransferase 6-like isoform X2 [Acanthaster planci]|uniref:Beta-1,4-galactosyltransferase n=1 Tax=Acanthaster planci TaxID=133434 RepID=A0A8B7YAD3_ACAPL|nr:beta-1,4-galactosyltransferase 6-like isoform X2 [Acanthaster planci]